MVGLGQLVVFASFPGLGVEHREIMGREVFLFDDAASAIWQINPEQGTTDGRTREFDRSNPTIEPFVNVWQADDGYFASRFSGDTFRIDLRTGSARYSGWART
ncbi:hypothetical protein DVW87_06925 [Sphingomonas aracearum]|uniref:Uncharacterized protein n=1 Tax=Sphingomonas aracearum TaxID=2283317 RepID=A0A369VZX4_9SPHN|nr:hypothetical protein DVW87_06925 [Sphingomonas aracearum]